MEDKKSQEVRLGTKRKADDLDHDGEGSKVLGRPSLPEGFTQNPSVIKNKIKRSQIYGKLRHEKKKLKKKERKRKQKERERLGDKVLPPQTKKLATKSIGFLFMCQGYEKRE